MITKVSKILFLLIVGELCLGGGGRFTAVGPVSLRMVLFSAALLMSCLLYTQKKKFSPEFQKLILGFGVMMVIAVLIGVINGNPGSLIFEDAKPLSYFLILPFFYFIIDEGMIKKVIKIIQGSSVLMATVFIVLLIFIHFGIISFLDFYNSTFQSGELFFRGEVSFFYKGFLFLGVGSIFFFFPDYSHLKKFLIAFLVTAIILSITRGLLFSLALTFFVYFLAKKKYIKAVIGFVLALTVSLWGSDFILSTSRWMDAIANNKTFSQADPTLLGDRNYSDNGRAAQAKEVWQDLSLGSGLWGHGFGRGTLSRPVHMEISYLEIFHKQGLIGLAFWGYFAFVIFGLYRISSPSAASDAFFYCAVFIFVESLTNQYMNNPIGMSMLLLSVCSLNKLKT